VRQLLPHLAKRAEDSVHDLHLWFDSTMDRVSQRFTMHTRIGTVVFSVVVAVVLQLDSVELVRRLASDAEFRARLVESADLLSRKGDELLASSGSTNAPATLYLASMKQLKESEPALAGLPEPAGITNLHSASAWLRANLPRQLATNQTQVSAWLGQYTNLIPQSNCASRPTISILY